MAEQTEARQEEGRIGIQLEKFSAQGRQALALAEEEARGLNHNYVGTEHLLLGILSEDGNVGALVLRNMGVEAAFVRKAIEHVVGRGEASVSGKIGLTPRAVTVCALAASEAFRLQHEKIGPGHLLLGIIREGEGLGAGLLESMGVKLDRARAQVYLAMVTSGRSVEVAGKGNVVTCRVSDGDLEAIDTLIEAGIRSTRSDAAAWLIHAGIESNRELLEKVYGTVAEIRRLRIVAQSLAQQAAGGEKKGSEVAEKGEAEMGEQGGEEGKREG